jgi:uncharacterized protein YndB with AHSA1/START domain
MRGAMGTRVALRDGFGSPRGMALAGPGLGACFTGSVSETKIVREFSVPPERLFDALADQDAMGSWMGAKISVPVRGANGLVGTVRRIHAGRVTLDERIVASEAPRFMAYELVPPVPLLKRHRGELRVESLAGGRSRVTWNILLELRFGLDALLLRVLNRSIDAALGRLQRRLERS